MDTITPNRARWRGIAGALAAIVVVGALATLLVYYAGSRGAASDSIHISPSGAPGQGSQPGLLPVVAPSNPSIVYRMANNRPERSTDGGRTYQKLTMPSSGFDSISDAWIAISPLDPSHIFMTISGSKAGSRGCEPSASVSNPIASATNAPVVGAALSGFADCAYQYFSVDSGQTWKAVSLPGGPNVKVLGGVNLFRLASGLSEDTEDVFQAQGTRLYAGAGFSATGGSLLQSEGARLLASDDGGVTWQVVDQAIDSQGLFTCDFAATPTGATVYAVVTNQSCANEGMGTLWLYRSDNGGQTWAKVSALPSAAEGGIRVASDGALYIFAPGATAQSHSISLKQTAQYALVSQNKGVSFTHAPSAGLPANGTLSGPVATLSDGSVVYNVAAVSNALYTWKPGQSSWRRVYESARQTQGCVVTPAAGGDKLTITDSTGALTTLMVQG